MSFNVSTVANGVACDSIPTTLGAFVKYLHTMLRVGDLEKSLQFYCEILGFTLISREDYSDGEFTLAFLSHGSNSRLDPMIELTYNWGVSTYELGTAYGHLAYGVSSISEVQANLKKHGLDLSWGPKASPSGRSVIAFLQDPDGYKIELIQEN